MHKQKTFVSERNRSISIGAVIGRYMEGDIHICHLGQLVGAKLATDQKCDDDVQLDAALPGLPGEGELFSSLPGKYCLQVCPWPENLK